MPFDVLNPKTIVVATDFSSAASGAVLHAIRFPKNLAACLVLVHVVDPIGNSSEEMDGSLHDMIDAAKSELGNLSSELTRQNVQNRWVVRHGNVRDSILDVAREYHADLLVVGNKGAVGGRPRHASIAEQLVRAAPCPVLTIVANEARTETMANYRRLILMPTDFSDASRLAFSFALSLALQSESALLLVHALECDSMESRAKSTRSLCTHGLNALLSEAYVRGVKTESVVRSGDPCQLILDVARQRKPDYIVMAARDGNLLDGTRLHGRLHHLMHQSPCPIFTICPPSPFQPITTPQRARMAWEMANIRN